MSKNQLALTSFLIACSPNKDLQSIKPLPKLTEDIQSIKKEKSGKATSTKKTKSQAEQIEAKVVEYDDGPYIQA